MYLKAVFHRFVQKSPVPVMTRALLENALGANELDALFADHAERQYEKKLLFSSIVDLMGMVVCNVQPSICAAYQMIEDTLPATLSAVYANLNGIEGDVTAAFVRTTARLGSVIEELGGQLPSSLPGYRIKIIDGNHFAATEHRLAVLREPRPGPCRDKPWSSWIRP